MKLKYIIIILSTVLLGAMIIPAIGPPTCSSGGNNSAQNVCRFYAMELMMYNYDQKNIILNYENVDQETQVLLAERISTHWTKNADYYIKTTDTKYSSNPKEIIIFCAKPYNDIPYTYLFDPPYTHAVGYSDGSTEYISIEQYQKIDKTQFRKFEKIKNKH
jgi:hypothetical protein